jgi:urease subunit alpha
MKIRRDAYVSLYGPTAGDLVRLADTDLFLRVERDAATYGEEVTFGGGKVIRDGQGQSQVTRDGGAPDLVITNVIILDYWGVVKADVGVRDGPSARSGGRKPRRQDGVTPESRSARPPRSSRANTKSRRRHRPRIHFISPQQVWEALYSGVTTMIGGGTGPADGTRATTCTPGEWNIHRMIEATESLPMNFGFLGKGNASDPAALVEQIRAGAAGLKLHEDWGTPPATVEASVSVAGRSTTCGSRFAPTRSRIGFVEGRSRRVQGTNDPHVFGEGAGGSTLTSCVSVPSPTSSVERSDDAVYAEHAGRASRMLIVCHPQSRCRRTLRSQNRASS